MIRNIAGFLAQFKRPKQALWAIIATAFVLAMLLIDTRLDETAAVLLTNFSGVLALAIGTGFLARGARAMMSGRTNFALLMGALSLLIFAVGIIEILVAGAADFSKELAAMVAAGILGFFVDED